MTRHASDGRASCWPIPAASTPRSRFRGSRERYGAEIIAVTLDLGQGKELEEIRDRALATGAVRAHVLDAREEFARDYIVRALKADALCDDRSPMAAALGRPLIAQKLVEIAGIEQATRDRARRRRPRRRRRSTGRPRARPDADRARARRRVGHDAARSSSNTRARRHVTLPVELSGSGRPRVRAAGPQSPTPRRAGVGRDRLRARRADRRQRRHDAAARSHRQPRHHRRRARRRPLASRLGRRCRTARARIALRRSCGGREAADGFLARRRPTSTSACCRSAARGSRRCARRSTRTSTRVQERVDRRRAAEAVQRRLRVVGGIDASPIARSPSRLAKTHRRRRPTERHMTTSGPAASTPRPTPRRSSSARRSASIAGCSKTT